MMSNRMRTSIWAAALAGMIALSGCAVPVPEFTPPPTDTQTFPVLDEDRLEKVLVAVNETLRDADADADKEVLSDRVEGRAAQMRGWEYSLAKATEKAEMEEPYQPQPLGTDPAVSAIAATDDWPREVMVITDPPEGGNVPLLLMLRQETVRDPYSLRGWVRLLPGVTTPQMHATASGSEPLAPDAGDLLLSPEETVAGYADVLNRGKNSDEAKTFDMDPYRELLVEERKALAESVEVAGKISQKTEPAGETMALSTFDGGAIVFGGMRTEQTYEKTVEGAKLKVGDMVSAKNGGEADVETKLTAVYQHMIAFYVPPADSDEKITVLGAERVLSSVKKPKD